MLIDRDALIEEIQWLDWVEQISKVIRVIEAQPTIDPVKHGLWIEHKGGDDYIGYPIYECSECGYDAGETATNYCPNCGALMREDGEEDG